jgi:hypothetical protein
MILTREMAGNDDLDSESGRKDDHEEHNCSTTKAGDRKMYGQPGSQSPLGMDKNGMVVDW